MNLTVIAAELAIMFLVFSFLAFGLLLLCPTAFVGDYPPDIQAAYYQSQHKQAQKQAVTTRTVIKKIVVILVYMLLFAWMAHMAGAKPLPRGAAW